MSEDQGSDKGTWSKMKSPSNIVDNHRGIRLINRLKNKDSLVKHQMIKLVPEFITTHITHNDTNSDSHVFIPLESTLSRYSKTRPHAHRD